MHNDYLLIPIVQATSALDLIETLHY